MRKRSGRTDFVDILVFLIPCFQFIQLEVVGVLNGSDVLLLASFVVLALLRRIKIATPVGRKFMIFCSLWLVSQCVTDIVRHTAFSDYARGWSNIGLTLVNFAVLWTLLYGRPGRLVLYGWGLVAGSALAFFISPDEFASEYPWKFGMSYPVTLAVFLLASHKKCRGSWLIVMIAAIGIINIGFGARNRGAVCLAAALYLLITRFLRQNSTGASKLKTRSLLAIAASIILGVVGVLWAYQYAAKAGILGEDASEKYEAQSSGDYGLLIGGRTEMLGSLPAIYDSPILGHGSWARDPIYLIAERQALAVMGYEDASDFSSDDLVEGYIPTHSYLFGAWVNAGIVGALFWAWVFVFIAWALMRIYPSTVLLLPIMAFFVFSLLWDILFSPYGATTRIVVTYYFVVLATCFSMVPRKTIAVTAGRAKLRVDSPIVHRP